MRLTAYTDFGLRTLMLLAGAPGRSFSTADIAGEFRISRHHLMKVVRGLAEAGFVQTRRGGGGGLALTRPADSIRIGEIVRALESGAAMVECFRADGGACVLTPRCRLIPRLAAAEEAFYRELDRSTLADCAYPPDSIGQTPGSPTD